MSNDEWTSDDVVSGIDEMIKSVLEGQEFSVKEDNLSHQVDSIQTHLLNSDMNLTDPKTPEKSSRRGKDLSNSTLKSCAREFGCVTPKTKFKKVSQTTMQNC